MGKRVTIYDVARELGVSTATVTRALNNKGEISEATRKNVIETAKRIGYRVNPNARSLARAPIHINFLIQNKTPTFHDEIIAGVQHQFLELKDNNVSGDMCILYGDSLDINRQYIQHLQKQLEEKPDGVVILSPSQTEETHKLISQMSEAGIKVALVNSDLPGSGRLCCCRQDAVLAGRMAAELLHRMTPSGKVLVFTGHKNVLDHASSAEGFCEECEKRGMKVLAICENHDDYDFASYNTERLLRQYPDVEGIYINTANSVAVCKKLKELNLQGRISVVASDVFNELEELMREDVIQATIFQDPFRQGRNAVKQLYRAICFGAEVPPDILIRPQIVMQSNLSEYIYYDKTE